MTRSRIDRERAQRRDGDDLVLGERAHPGHAQQARAAVDLGAARAALAGLAVPADREVRGLGGLQAMDDVEDDLTLVDLDGEVLQRAVGVVAAPDAELGVVASSGVPLRQDGEFFVGHVLLQLGRSNSDEQLDRHDRERLLLRRRCVAAVAVEAVQTRLTLRHSGRMPGKSSRV